MGRDREEARRLANTDSRGLTRAPCDAWAQSNVQKITLTWTSLGFRGFGCGKSRGMTSSGMSIDRKILSQLRGMVDEQQWRISRLARGSNKREPGDSRPLELPRRRGQAAPARPLRPHPFVTRSCRSDASPMGGCASPTTFTRRRASSAAVVPLRSPGAPSSASRSRTALACGPRRVPVSEEVQIRTSSAPQPTQSRSQKRGGASCDSPPRRRRRASGRTARAASSSAAPRRTGA